MYGTTMLVLASLSMLLSLDTHAQFLDRDLLFEESDIDPRWKEKSVISKAINSLESSLDNHPSSDRSIWDSALTSFERFRRALVSSLSGTSEEETDTTKGDSVATSEPKTLSTLSRGTRSTDPFNSNSTSDIYLSGLNDDDEDLGASSGSGLPPEVNEVTPAKEDTSEANPHQTVYHRVILAVHEPYLSEYENRYSSKFTEFSEAFSAAVNKLMDNIPGHQITNVVNIQKKSDDSFASLVTLDITSEGYNNPEAIRQFLQEHIQKYQSIGSFTLSSSNIFKFTDYGARVESICTPGDFECPTKSGENCLPPLARCNGTLECLGGEDEDGCPNLSTEISTSSEPPEPEISQFVGLGNVKPLPNGTDDRCRADDKVQCKSDHSVYICEDQICDEHEDCPDGTDEQNCPPDPHECSSDQFQCDSSLCIPRNEQCDGTPQCGDGTDEQNCPEPACPGNEFKCQSGGCVDQELVCNRQPDCEDSSDEYNCHYACDDVHQFKCDDNSCIDLSKKCDRTTDCIDGSDERDCPPIECTAEEFACWNGNCIKLNLRCDGTNDCQDTSDELNCNVQCTSDQFKCRNGSCINMSLKCNEIPNCPDGSDEEDCEQPLCGAGEFRCNNGRCLPNYSVCNGYSECQDGEDENNCPACQPYELPCRDGRGCYLEKKKCDFYPDCLDSSDEEFCRVQCLGGEFRCNDGKCIRDSFKCDNVTDCSDKSDELNCSPTCSSSELTCEDGSCVPNYLKCDGRNDCRNGEDERDCPTCRSSELTCEDGTCVPLYLKCDGRNDCRNGEDERDCPTHSTPVRCSSFEFACHSGNECVPTSSHCDSRIDCQDSSDEYNCGGKVDGLNLKTYPADQIIKEGRDVVFQCRDEGDLRANVRWIRDKGLPLPPNSQDINGRLEMPNIKLEHSGTYVCEASGFSASIPGSRVSVFLKVEPFEQQSTKKKECAFNEATCSNGDCIAKSKVCDSNYDCTDGSDELRCNPYGCEPNQFRCENMKCVSRSWRCDSDDDCGDGSDEKNCDPSPPGSRCKFNEFQCAKNDQCIPKSFHCDVEMDCLDGTDEYGCRKPEILQPPPSMSRKHPGDTFTINCTAVGVPTPEIVWRLNWNNIPKKCTTTSVEGFGVLTCTNIQESDQGAYSCEALNNQGTLLAIPDTILIVNRERTLCPEGMFNELARREEECIPCFCFGISSTCHSADLFVSQHRPPVIQKVINVYIMPNGGLDVRMGEYSQFQASINAIGRSSFQISFTNNELTSSYDTPVYPYFALPDIYLGNQLKSYGGYLKFNIKSDGTGIPLPIPDIIIIGNGITLVYKGAPINPRIENSIGVRFFPGYWYKVQPDSGTQFPASRQDIMMVLDQVDQLLIRSRYFQDGSETTVSDISMDTAVETDKGQGKASLVEKCSCPVGYTGSSCETCASGYKHQPGSWIGTCQGPVICPPMYYRDSDNRCQPCSCPHSGSAQFSSGCSLAWDSSVICECYPGYEGRNCERCANQYEGNPLLNQPCIRRREPECDPAGSTSTQVDPYTGRCTCKEYVTGPTCNQCKANAFYLALGNEYGCIYCFCMGHNTACSSSDLYRTQIGAAFTRDSQGFKLAEANRIENPITDIQVNPSSQEIVYKHFNTPGVYYWVLPSKFLQNKVTSYGGYLRYTVRYVPIPGGQSSPNNAPDVEITSENMLHLVYYNRNQPLPEANQPVTIVVPLLEQHWRRISGEKVNREHFLMALAQLDSILIKATYTTSTWEAALISVYLDTATTERNTGQSRALEVELCQCPTGYRGTSCEECDAGYTRIEEGLYLGSCEPCSCNSHSTQCDPETGNCTNCGGYTRGQHCELCIDGFQGNPAAGVECTPHTEGCRCDPRGSTSPICDRNQQCQCKTNVVGQSCNECRPGTFDLSSSNPEGCIECYCSGVSNQCQSSNTFREAIPMQIIDDNHSFTLTDRNRYYNIKDGFILNPSMNQIAYDFSNERPQEILYWSLPPQFTGNKVTSYGGNLNFTKKYTSLENPPHIHNTDVVLFGSTVLLFWVDEEHTSPDVPRAISIPLREQNWRRQDPVAGTRIASRAELMEVLSKLQAILILAKDYHTQISYLSDISLDSTVPRRDIYQQVAGEVEACVCPPGYTGTSCESCITGFYKDFDGTCKKCPCNGNEEYCALGPQQQVICTCKPSHTGTYCEQIADFSLGPPEKIAISISEPTIIVIEAGKDVTFTCKGHSLESKQVELTWSKENGYLPPERAYDNHKGVLVIQNVQSYDAGTYICTASDGFTSVTEKALLNVGGLLEQPVVTVRPTSMEVREGEPVEFRCGATGLPTPTLQWVSERSDRMPPASSFSSGVFRIPYTSLQDEGSYKCIARNSAGEQSVTVYLSVRSAPPRPTVSLNVQPSRYSGIAGEVIRLECKASSNRNIRVQWSRQDGALSRSSSDEQGVLVIYNSKPEDSGIYTCTAVELHTGAIIQEVRGQVIVSPPHRPQPALTIDPPQQTVPQGSLAEIRCFSRDGPVVWTKAGDQLSPYTKIEGSILRIPNVQVIDRGVYVCDVQSSGGRSRETSILEVERREMPVVKLFPNDTQKVLEGHGVMFHCHVIQGIPEPSVRWSRVDGTPLPQHIEQLPNGVLRIDSVLRSDKGQYLCTADNPEGSANSVAVIEVNSAPVIYITPVGQTINVSPRQHVRLECRATGHPKPTVFWSKHQGGYSYHNKEDITPKSYEIAVYEIRSAVLEDEGNYVCTAHNEAGTKDEGIQLTISDENVEPTPSSGSNTIYLPDNDFVVPLGGNATIICKTPDPQQIYIKWVRQDRRPLNPTATIRDGTLYIDRVQYTDAGEYTCQAINDRGQVLFDAIAQLRVIRPIQIKLEPERQVVRPGDDARIECTAIGEGPITISWFNANRQPLPQNVWVNGGIIEFKNIRESDAGKYICKAESQFGILEAPAVVTVKGHDQSGRPRALDRNPRAMEGSFVKLSCGDYPQIQWNRDGQPLPTNAVRIGSDLRIDNLRLEDAGRYICHINYYGSKAEDYIDVYVDRLETPNVEIKIQPSKRDVRYGDSVDLRCLTVGSPNAKVRWTLADGSVYLPNNAREEGELLRITRATLDNVMTYRCVVFINTFRFHSDYYLTVHDDRPTHDAAAAETVTANYGQTVDLECAIDLEGQITHEWNKHGGPLPSSAKQSGPHLIIPSVSYKEAGLYICTANNGNIQADIPKIILVQGAVPFFAQAPLSYIALPTLPHSHLTFNIEITFKPENPNGLILYNGNGHNGTSTTDFVSFGLKDGVPEFRFDVGSGPGLVRASQPLSMAGWHTVQLNRVKREGSMYIDDEHYFSNTSRGRMQGLDLTQPMYIGGVPNFFTISKQNGFETGFVGCISRLIINNKDDIDIMKEQKDSEGVTSCETCAVNPCVNTGVCQEAPTRTGYMCLCPRGFSGLNCSHTGEPCYPGACGTGHCLDSEEGLECSCPLGRTGERCEKQMTITEPSFSRNSYLAYPTPKRLNKIKINIRFNAAGYSNGLLLYCAEHEDGTMGTTDFVSLSIRNRRVEFKLDSGTGIKTLQSTSEVVPGQWITVNVIVAEGQASLSVTGDSLPVTEKVPSDVLKLTTPMYIGGLDKQRIKPSGGVGVRQGFEGCISEVYVLHLSLDIIQSVVDSANINQCSVRQSDPCQLAPCQNNGVCSPGPDHHTYHCSCSSGFSGENCEVEQNICISATPCHNGGSCIVTSISYKCVCLNGYAGPTCEQRMGYLEDWSFKGDGFVELDRNLLPHYNPDEEEIIHIEFSTTQPNGLLFWHGQTPETYGKGQDYWSVAVVDGFLQLSYALGSSPPTTIVSKTRVDDEQKHTTEIRRKAKSGSIRVDDGDVIEDESEGLQIQLNTEGNIYIGGAPDIDHMTGTRSTYKGFIGCIHSLQIQDFDQIDLAEKALSSSNLTPCSSASEEGDEVVN